MWLFYAASKSLKMHFLSIFTALLHKITEQRLIYCYRIFRIQLEKSIISPAKMIETAFHSETDLFWSTAAVGGECRVGDDLWNGVYMTEANMGHSLRNWSQ